MNKHCEKEIRRAYRKGRKDGFDHGMAVANAIYAEVTADLIAQHQQEIEALNSEIILGQEEEEGDDEHTD